MGRFPTWFLVLALGCGGPSAVPEASAEEETTRGAELASPEAASPEAASPEADAPEDAPDADEPQAAPRWSEAPAAIDPHPRVVRTFCNAGRCQLRRRGVVRSPTAALRWVSAALETTNQTFAGSGSTYAPFTVPVGADVHRFHWPTARLVLHVPPEDAWPGSPIGPSFVAAGGLMSAVDDAGRIHVATQGGHYAYFDGAWHVDPARRCAWSHLGVDRRGLPWTLCSQGLLIAPDGSHIRTPAVFDYAHPAVWSFEEDSPQVFVRTRAPEDVGLVVLRGDPHGDAPSVDAIAIDRPSDCAHTHGPCLLSEIHTPRATAHTAEGLVLFVERRTISARSRCRDVPCQGPCNGLDCYMGSNNPICDRPDSPTNRGCTVVEGSERSRATLRARWMDGRELEVVPERPAESIAVDATAEGLFLAIEKRGRVELFSVR
ncbi:MAG: hypothetical protein AAGE52_13415 [Myxococcota bacterium]